MAAKAKLRTSEDLYKRLKQALQWEEDWLGEEDLWLGYKDGVFGPMEQRFSAFAPIAEGGDLPFTRIWYCRRGDDVIWDRRRRYDALWGSGDTPAIQAFEQRGRKAVGFDADEDSQAVQQTLASIRQARETLAQMEEERQIKMVEKQKRKLRQQRQRLKQQEEQAQRNLAGEPALAPDILNVAVLPGHRGKSAPPRMRFTIATWNCLNDDYLEAPELHSSVRAPELLAALAAADPDVVVLQEVTPAILQAVGTSGLHAFWRTEAAGELAVLSRHPIGKAFSVSLGDQTSKKALIIEVVVRGRTVAIANIHFTGDRRGQELVDNSVKRQGQARMLLAALAKHAGHAEAFVCGDFNEPNFNGVEVAAACMDSMVDAWTAVHADGHPGCTFDPDRNELAAHFAIDRRPRRIDRIFAPSKWIPQAAALLGEDKVASDHFGLVASFSLESGCSAQPVHTSALVVLPPEVAWQQIDRIRQRCDPSFHRWMPHINVLYGFLPEEHFDEAIVAAEAVMRRHGPFELRLETFAVFEHGRSASLVLRPTCSVEGGMEALQADLQMLFPKCTEQSSREAGYQPHLTVGKFDTAEEARRVKAELEQEWVPVTFVVDGVALLARTGSAPFGVRAHVPLGSALSPADAALLEALEQCSGGARAFPLGSAMLLGADRPLSSDLDVLLVGSKDCEATFEDLCRSMQAAWVRRPEDQASMLTMKVGGVQLDIHYVRSACCQHPLRWPASERSAGGRAMDALRDSHSLRAAILRAHGVFGWRRYQKALLGVKQWAKARCVYGNALGYFGGWSWSALLAATALAGERHDADLDGSALAAAMFQRFASWPWPRPVELALWPADALASSPPLGGFMPVRCLSDPSANSARNVTAATGDALRAELRAAAGGAPAGPVLAGVRVVVRVEVGLRGAEMEVCSAWLEARLLRLVRLLDPLRPRPARAAPGLWAVGLAAPQARLLGRVVEEFRERVARDAAQDFPHRQWGDVIDIKVEDPEDFKQAMKSRCRASA